MKAHVFVDEAMKIDTIPLWATISCYCAVCSLHGNDCESMRPRHLFVIVWCLQVSGGCCLAGSNIADGLSHLLFVDWSLSVFRTKR